MMEIGWKMNGDWLGLKNSSEFAEGRQTLCHCVIASLCAVERKKIKDDKTREGFILEFIKRVNSSEFPIIMKPARLSTAYLNDCFKPILSEFQSKELKGEVFGF